MRRTQPTTSTMVCSLALLALDLGLTIFLTTVQMAPEMAVHDETYEPAGMCSMCSCAR